MIACSRSQRPQNYSAGSFLSFFSISKFKSASIFIHFISALHSNRIEFSTCIDFSFYIDGGSSAVLSEIRLLGCHPQ